jgi:uncharacterized protein YqgC (DUF456 family)
MFGVDLVLLAALALLVAGVVGSALPSLPGPLLSLVGVVAYWLWGGDAVGSLTLTVLAVVAIAAVVVDWLAGSIAARYGGASWTASILAGVVGFVLFFAVGPIGIVVGIAGTVFVVEVLREDAQHATRAAAYTTIGALGSTVVQVLVTLGLLATFALALLV